MNVKVAMLAAALSAASAPASAGETTVEVLAKETGLSERHVRMIIGARTPYAEYRYVYDRKLRQFKAGIGEANYERLISGEPVVLPSGQRVDLRVASAR